MFLYSVLTYYWLVLEAFIADGFVSQEKLVRIHHVLHVEGHGCSVGRTALISHPVPDITVYIALSLHLLVGGSYDALPDQMPHLLG
jgi:hypothetical protein